MADSLKIDQNVSQQQKQKNCYQSQYSVHSFIFFLSFHADSFLLLYCIHGSIIADLQEFVYILSKKVMGSMKMHPKTPYMSCPAIFNFLYYRKRTIPNHIHLSFQHSERFNLSWTKWSCETVLSLPEALGGVAGYSDRMHKNKVAKKSLQKKRPSW